LKTLLAFSIGADNERADDSPEKSERHCHDRRDDQGRPGAWPQERWAKQGKRNGADKANRHGTYHASSIEASPKQ
ncbi:hypothetical protein ACP3WF_24290, partial [Salmonella enterica]|uniref:hypothetical protein n=1 Tax=Salmonella enterica TaxID=28901 RepID=UPI003CF933CD